MKKIFILTGEASGDKLASKAINSLKKINPNIEYLSVGGENLKKIGVDCFLISHGHHSHSQLSTTKTPIINNLMAILDIVGIE